MSLLLAALIAVQSPATVTFTHPCDSAPDALNALGEHLGIELKAVGSIERDYIILALKDAQIQATLDKIADVLDAQWKRTDDGLLLSRSRNTEQSQAKASRDRQVEWIKTEISKSRLPQQLTIASALDFVQGYEKALTEGDGRGRQYASSNGPLPAYGRRLVELLQPEKIVLQPDNVRLRIDLSVRPDIVKAISQMTQDLVVLRTALNRAGPAIQSPQAMNQVLLTGELTTPALGVRISESFLEIELAEASTGKSVQRWMYNSNPIRGIDVEHLTLDSERRHKITPLQDSLRKQINFSGPRETWRKGEQPSELIQLLRGADDTDPLQPIVGDVLEMVADELGTSLVALVPDELMIYPDWMYTETEPLLAHSWSRMRRFVEGRNEDGFLTVVPRNKARARDYRLDRSALASFVNTVLEQGRLSLRSTSALAVASKDIRHYSSHARLGSAALPIKADQPVPGSFNALKLYGSLSSVQRAALARDGELTMNLINLDPKLQQLVFRSVYGSGFEMILERPSQNHYWNYTPTGFGYIGETWISLSGTLPADSRVKMLRENGDLLFAAPSRQSGFGMTGGSTVSGVATMIVLQERVDLGEGATDFSNLAVAPVERFELQVEIPGLGLGLAVAQISGFTQNSQFYNYTQLPQPYRSELAEEIVKKSKQKIGIGGPPP